MFKVIRTVIGLAFIYTCFTSCIPNKPQNEIGFNLDITKREVQLAYEAGFKHSKDSLLTFLSNQNPTIRYIALNAFASMQDTSVVDTIGRLLADEDQVVRTAAAYTLGQIRNVAAEPILTKSFVKFDSLNKNAVFNATILEALGKCGTSKTLELLSSIHSYQPSDSILNTGLARGLYRFALRGMSIDAGTNLMLRMLINPAYSYETRLYAANYFSRLNEQSLKTHTDTLISVYHALHNRNLQMPLITGIVKGNAAKATNFLLHNLKTESDHKLKVALISNLQSLPYAEGDTIAFTYIKDGDDLIARLAAQYLFDKGNAIDAQKYFDKFSDPNTNSACHLELLGASNKFLVYNKKNIPLKSGINALLKDSLLRIPDVYRKADIIRFLAGDVTNFTFIHDVTDRAPDKIIQVVGMESYGDILANPYFATIYRSNFIVFKKQIFGYIIDGLLSGDVGLVSTAASTLRRPELAFKAFLPSDSIFKIALKRIKLPEDAEAYTEVAKTLSYWNGKPPIALPDKGFRMLDWAVLNNINDSTRCEIITDAGNIIIHLKPSIAPLTVANWIELVKRNYFNGKVFHRVVPNFVIQSGCNRGDGFGSMDYLIRSELPMVYYDKPGKVGMASAGLNTESCQFFITSMPTPHLDGRYTQFAELVSNPEILEKIQRGTKIKKITIK